MNTIFLGDSNALRADIQGNRSEGGLGWSYLRYLELGSHIVREKPDRFVFALGLNDILRGSEEVEYKGKTVTREHMAHMVMRDCIKGALDHCDHVAVCAVLGVDYSNWPDSGLSPACWNKYIVKPACKELGAAYIPHFPNPIFEPDGIHLTNPQENADWIFSHLGLE